MNGRGRMRETGGGFTIIEIMLSITILMLILFSIYATWSSILWGTKAGLDAAAEVQRARVAMRSIEEALSTAQMFEANLKYYYFQADTSEENASLSFVSRLPLSFPGSGMFGDQVLRRVSFTLEPGTNETLLMMRQIPVLLPTNDAVQPFPIILARDVTMFNLRFWDARAGDWTDEYTTTNQLPKMVEVTLGFGKQNSFSKDPAEIVQRIVALPSSVVTRDMQVPTPGAALNINGAGRGRPPRFVKQDGEDRVLDDGSRVHKDGSVTLPDGRILKGDDARRYLQNGLPPPLLRPGGQPGPGGPGQFGPGRGNGGGGNPGQQPAQTVPPTRRNPGGRR